jgi:serine O-acetyltransferase
MSWAHYKALVLSDLYRNTGGCTWRVFLFHLVLGEAFPYLFWLRTSRYLRDQPVLRYLCYPIARLLLRRQKYRLGIDIPFDTAIGAGLFIGHFTGIFVNQAAVIGNNCNISQCVTIGGANRGNKKGYPVLGDNVYIGPGAKIVGAVKIGNHVAIGANCVVTKDLPDYAVVVGVPARIISYDGSAGYVNRTDYDPIPATAVKPAASKSRTPSATATTH